MASPDSLRVAIEALHQAIADHQDPQQKQVLAACLQNLMKVQAADYQALQQGGPRAAIAGALGQ